MKTHLAVAAVLAITASAPSFAVRLITDAEAKLPEAAPRKAIETRGITRGPGIKLVSPDLTSGTVKTTFDLKVAFEPHGGAKVDPATVKVTYLKATPVDLLERVKAGLTPGGIDLSGVEVPAGEHQIQVSLQDTEGRKATTVINLKAAK